MKSALTTLLAIFMAFAFNKGCGDETKPFSADVNLDELTKFAAISKSPCFGKCPVYEMTIYDDGVIAYRGKNFVDKEGLHVKKLNSGEIKALKAYINDVNLWQYDDDYPSNVTDLAMIRISHFKDGKTKTVRGNIKRPKEIKELEKYLDNLANSNGWILKEAAPPKPGDGLDSHIIKNEIIAKFNKDVDIEAFVANFKLFDLKVKERIAPNLDLWLLTFDTNEIEPERMLNELKKTEEVIDAEFNKNLSNRNGNGRN